jgi:hypothetical protein
VDKKAVLTARLKPQKRIVSFSFLAATSGFLQGNISEAQKIVQKTLSESAFQTTIG